MCDDEDMDEEYRGGKKRGERIWNRRMTLKVKKSNKT